MILRRPAWPVAAMLLVAFATPAAAGDGGGLKLAELIAIAQRDNKDLQAARYAVDLGHARLQQAGLRSNPTLDIAGRSDVLFGHDGEYSRAIGISQAFPVAGRLLREKDVARVDVALAEAEVAEAERRVAEAVASDAYRLYVLDRRIESRSDLTSAETQLARVTRERFKAAEVSELDVNTVQLDLRRLDQERAQLVTERDAVVAGLNTRLGRAADTPLRIAGPVPAVDTLPTLAVLQTQALTHRPDLRATLLGIDRAQSERALAKASRWGDWSLGVELSQDKLVLDGAPPQRPSRAIGFSVSIPLPLVNRTAGKLAEAQAAEDQALARSDALRLAIGNEVAGAHAQLVRLSETSGAYEHDVRPLTERNVRLAQQGYRQGLVPLTDVVQAQRQQVDLLDDHLTTLDQFLQAWVRLHTAIGDYAADDKEISHD